MTWLVKQAVSQTRPSRTDTLFAEHRTASTNGTALAHADQEELSRDYEPVILRRERRIWPEYNESLRYPAQILHFAALRLG